MSFRDFTLDNIEERLGLTLTSGSLFAPVPAVTPRPEFLDLLHDGAALAQGINSEKAKSEFVIAPILLEFHRLRERRNGVFSGVEFDVDSDSGLNGVCDFLITRNPRPFLVTAPVIAVAEGKNDNVRYGLAQCMAGMRAAWLFNAQKHEPVSQVFGASTTGTHWQFLRLRDREVTVDLDNYFLPEIGKILGILLHMAETA